MTWWADAVEEAVEAAAAGSAQHEPARVSAEECPAGAACFAGFKVEGQHDMVGFAADSGLTHKGPAGPRAISQVRDWAGWLAAWLMGRLASRLVGCP